MDLLIKTIRKQLGSGCRDEFPRRFRSGHGTLNGRFLLLGLVVPGPLSFWLTHLFPSRWSPFIPGLALHEESPYHNLDLT